VATRGKKCIEETALEQVFVLEKDIDASAMKVEKSPLPPLISLTRPNKNCGPRGSCGGMIFKSV
jgi:hypothetical protein